MTDAKPKRRLFRFSLQGLLVLVTIVCVWLGSQVNWIRERHQVLKQSGQSIFVIGGDVPAPWSIRLFEHGFREICVDPAIATDATKVHEMKRLFPEAVISTPEDGRPSKGRRQFIKVKEI